MLFTSFIFIPAFPLGKAAGATAPGRPGMHYGQQQFQVVQLAPHQGRTKKCRRCSHSTCALDDLWAAFPWVKPAELVAAVFHGPFWTLGRTKAGVISRFGQMTFRALQISQLRTLSRSVTQGT